jgi:hypothetical protein
LIWRQGFPWGKLSPQATDEGRFYHALLLIVSLIRHGFCRATFPRGKAHIKQTQNVEKNGSEQSEPFCVQFSRLKSPPDQE